MSRHLDYMKRVKRTIDNAYVVAFDVFDTLIIRLVNEPSQIFDIVEKKSREVYNTPIKDFKKLRISAEKKAEENKVPNIDDIYSCLDIQGDEKRRKIKEIEINTEFQYCLENKEIKNIYEYCVKSNKEIYVVSDMYLSSNIIKRILEKNGYSEIAGIIVSCEYNENKESGELYSHLPRKSEVVHIGDSWKADFLGAKRAGLKTVHVQKKRYRDTNANLASICSYISTGNYFENIGINIVGPLLAVFSYWLRQSVKTDSKLFFLSREGKIMKSVYDTLYPQASTYYLQISRRAITLANYNNKHFNNMTEILQYFTIKKDSRVVDFLKYLNIELDIDESVLNKNAYSIESNNMLVTRIKKAIEEKSFRECLAAKKYFEQEGLTENVSIVDIGWKGTMQTNIQSFCDNAGISIACDGYYLLTLSEKTGFNSFIKATDQAYQSVIDNPVLVENLLQCQEGSTQEFRITNGVAEAIKRPCEFDDVTKAYIDSLWRGVSVFCAYWKQYGFVKEYDHFKQESMERLDSFISSPRKQDIEYFERFKYSDTKVDYMVSHRKTPAAIKAGFLSSGWKYGYYRKLFGTNLGNKTVVKLLKNRAK